MSNLFRVAAVQMSSGDDQPHNLRRASALIEQGAAAGAQLIALPETFAYLGRSAQMVGSAESIPGPTSDLLCALAKRLSITLVAGSYCEQSPDPTKCFNTSLLIDPTGTILAQYRKRHLFDFEIPSQVSCRESSWLLPGDALCATPTPCGTIGQAICYDLRFPELFRELVDLGSAIFCIPAAFTLATGRDHWEILLRARAIENQCYVIAPNQYGQHAPGLTTYGRSMIVDPWGTVLATAADGEGVILAEIDLDRITSIRQRLPALEHRRLILRPR
ncbi:MAG TPA: carbon-nitrogen hydrolase family protein [Pirellulales bacterium]|nr:carbon-nitrogen hydrolase family protein [Pirellulales bacterium]